MKNCTVYFEDNGQDFLEFDIVNHRVVACRPTQGWVWEGKKAVEVRDEFLWILMRNEDGTLCVTNINHKVVKVVEHEVDETETYPVNPKQVVMRPVAGSLVDFGQQLYLVNDAWITHTKDATLRKNQQAPTLAKVEAAAADVDQRVLDFIASKNGKETEGEIRGFAEEMAVQYGFVYLDDDATVMAVTAKRLVEMMFVLGYGRHADEQDVQAKRYRALRQAAITDDIAFLNKASGYIESHQGKGGTISEAVYDAGLDAAIAAKEKGYGNQN